MWIIRLADVERYWRTAVSNFAATHSLRAMQMTQRDIGNVRRENIRGQRFLASDQNSPFAVRRSLRFRHKAMARRDQKLAVSAFFSRGIDDFFVDAPHAV